MTDRFALTASLLALELAGACRQAYQVQTWCSKDQVLEWVQVPRQAEVGALKNLASVAMVGAAANLVLAQTAVVTLREVRA